MEKTSIFSVLCAIVSTNFLSLMELSWLTRTNESTNFSIQSDVYSFGVFLVELVSGRSVASDQSIIQWVNVSLPDACPFFSNNSHIYPFLGAWLLKFRPTLFVPILMCRYRTFRNQVISLQSLIIE
jgi:hypothetical protein